MQTIKVIEHIKQNTLITFTLLNTYSYIDDKSNRVYKTEEILMKGIVGHTSYPHLWVTLQEEYNPITGYNSFWKTHHYENRLPKGKYIGFNRKNIRDIKLID